MNRNIKRQKKAGRPDAGEIPRRAVRSFCEYPAKAAERAVFPAVWPSGALRLHRTGAYGAEKYRRLAVFFHLGRKGLGDGAEH